MILNLPGEHLLLLMLLLAGDALLEPESPKSSGLVVRKRARY